MGISRNWTSSYGDLLKMFKLQSDVGSDPDKQQRLDKF